MVPSAKRCRRHDVVASVSPLQWRHNPPPALLVIRPDSRHPRRRRLPLPLLLVTLMAMVDASPPNLNLMPRQFLNYYGGNSSRVFRFQSGGDSGGGASPPDDSFRLIVNHDYGGGRYAGAAGAAESSAEADEGILIGARDALYNLSARTLQPRYKITWKALGQTIEECHMKGKIESECHNFIRVAAPLRNGRTLVCGTNAFSPQCREYEPLAAAGGGDHRFVEREQFNGQAISPYNPNHNSTFVYSAALNRLFAATVSDIGGSDPLIHVRQLSSASDALKDGGEKLLRTPKDDRVLDHAQFVGSFVYRDYVYVWYRERAAESLDNNREPQTYARVARICAADRGIGAANGVGGDRFATFLKARLNCSVASGAATADGMDGGGGAGAATDDVSTAFYFNELQAISAPVPDGGGDDALVFGVFHTSKALLMSAVCAFRMSQIAAIFDHGRFKTQRTPTSLWAPYQKFYATAAERPGRCGNAGGAAGASAAVDASIVGKNPLMYDLVPTAADAQRPLLVEGPGRAPLTAIAALARPARAVRAQRHHVIYVGRADGTVGKLVDTSLNATAVLVENVRVFALTDAVTALHVMGGDQALIVAGRRQVARLPLEHCDAQRSCVACVRLRDPHCAWDVDALACIHRRDWTQGSYVQNILKGVSEQCPGGGGAVYDESAAAFADVNSGSLLGTLYSIDESGGGQPFAALTKSGALLNDGGGGVFASSHAGSIVGGGSAVAVGGAATSLSMIALAVVISSVFGFLIGCRVAKWQQLVRRSAAGGATNGVVGGGSSSSGGGSSAASAADDDYEHFGRSSASGGLRATARRLSQHHNAALIVNGGALSGAPHHKHSVASDAISLAFGVAGGGGNAIGAANQYVPLSTGGGCAAVPVYHHGSVSNGGSGAVTPLHDARSTVFMGGGGGATLPRDYKVKKVYL